MVDDPAREVPEHEETVVLVVEDHRMLAEALLLGLEERGFRGYLAELTSAEGILEQAESLRPRLVVLDLDLGVLDGLDLVRGLRSGGARVLVVSGCRDETRLAAAVALGAAGFVSKTGPFEKVLEAVELAAGDLPLVAPTRHEELARAGRARLESEHDLKARAAALTEREREVLVAMAEGLTAAEIAGRLFVSVGTVRAHIRAILTKLGVSTQLAAVAIAQQLTATRRGGSLAELRDAFPHHARGATPPVRRDPARPDRAGLAALPSAPSEGRPKGTR